MFYIGLYRENHEIIFLSETTRHRALIFGMLYPLVNLYQVFLKIISLGPKMDPPWSHMFYIGLYIEKHIEKIFLSETISPRALIFGM